MHHVMHFHFHVTMHHHAFAVAAVHHAFAVMALHHHGLSRPNKAGTADSKSQYGG